MKPSMRIFAGVVAAALVGGSSISQADACGHHSQLDIAMRNPPKVDTPAKTIHRAERLLARGNPKSAAKLALDAYPSLEQLPPGERVSPLLDRAQRVVAEAVVRTRGALRIGRNAGRSEDERSQNRMWAAFVMQYQYARHHHDPSIQLQYAQAMAEVDGLESSAYKMLQDMAQEDLMPTAGGYLTLAALQAKHGDVAGHEASMARCQEIAGSSHCSLAAS